MKKQAESLRDEIAQIVAEHAQRKPSGPVVFPPALIAQILEFVRTQQRRGITLALCAEQLGLPWQACTFSNDDRDARGAARSNGRRGVGGRRRAHREEARCVRRFGADTPGGTAVHKRSLVSPLLAEGGLGAPLTMYSVSMLCEVAPWLVRRLQPSDFCRAEGD